MQLRCLLGPEADWWEGIRSATLPLLDNALSRVGMYAAYQLSPKEYVGHITADIEKSEEILYEAGFRRNPIAAIKTLRDDRKEKSSWAYRESFFSHKQVHVMLFEGINGGTDMYAHEEYSSINPLVMRKHYNGVGYSPRRGKMRLKKLLKNVEY